MKRHKLNWRVLGSIMVITLVAVGAVIGTRAYFSDTEASRGNTYQAGAVDLTIDNTSYYNGELNPASSWQLANLDDGNGPSGEGQYLFFNFADLKPGDWGEDTISLHVNNNDAWLCADVTLTENAENGITEPEAKLQDTEERGELADETNFVWWVDDGDNVLETDETVIQQVNLGQAPMNIPVPVILADSTKNLFNAEGGPLAGNTVHYIGKAWCYGAMELAPVQPGDNSPLGVVANSGILCDGEPVTNISQTDSAKLDVVFNAVQARHLDDFTCPSLRYPLTVNKTGNGTGTVNSDVEGIDCGEDCLEDIYRTTVVTLTATPDVSSNFTEWSGACTGTGTCVVTMDDAKNVTANFAIKRFTLNVTKSGTGTGTVYGSGINCGSTCSATYNYGTTVNLSQNVGIQTTFTGWGGDCTGTGSCSVIMDQARNVNAIFTKNQYPLTVSLSSAAAPGMVTASPAGISCLSDCTENYDYGTTVTLTANTISGYSFNGWGGDCSNYGTNPTCTIAVYSAKSVSAKYYNASTVTPNQDSYVSHVSSNSNYGAATILKIEDVWDSMGVTGDDKYSLVRFDLPSLPPGKSVISATLKLYFNSINGYSGIDIFPITQPWSENTVTYNNQPARDSVTKFFWAYTGWTNIDVTNWIQQMYGQGGFRPNYGFWFEANTAGVHSVYSRESGSNAPQLEIVY
ncbi:MAG: DNRLRE domain-containing protein [Patescibacteria group bacterium]